MANPVVNAAIRRLIQAGFPEGTARKIATGELSMDPAAKAARMSDLGFSDRPYYFGAPDVRGIRDQGGFSGRTMQAYNRDAGEFEEVLKATYLSPDRSLASTYADPRRAWDYQGAEPEVMALRMSEGNLLEVNAGGKKFNEVPLNKVRDQIPEERRGEFDAIVSRYADPTLSEEGKIRTGDLEIAANKLGYDGFRIKNVIDTYSGKGRPSEIVAVFDPARIRSPEAAFDPEQAGSSNILAGLGGAGVVGAGLMAPEEASASPLDRQDDVPAYMRRLDGTVKSERGFLGPIRNNVSGKTMTEVSVGQPGSEEGFYPLLVPTLTQEEVETIANMDLERERPPFSIIEKARAHAMERIDRGLSPFYQDGEEGAEARSPLERPEDVERRVNARALAVASDTLERLRRERGAVMSPLQDTRMARFGDYLTENRPSEMDPVQRALQSLGLFQGLGEYLRTTGEGQRTTTMQDINAALDVVPL